MKYHTPWRSRICNHSRNFYDRDLEFMTKYSTFEYGEFTRWWLLFHYGTTWLRINIHYDLTARHCVSHTSGLVPMTQIWKYRKYRTYLLNIWNRTIRSYACLHLILLYLIKCKRDCDTNEWRDTLNNVCKSHNIRIYIKHMLPLTMGYVIVM